MAKKSVEERLAGSVANRFMAELFRNTGQFPLAIVLIEVLTERAEYFAKPDLYVLVPAALIQAWWISKRSSGHPFALFGGNLIAPALYTLGEMAFEGFHFFSAPHHVAYWVFALCIGLLQACRFKRLGLLADGLLVLENLTRSMILFTAYVIFERGSHPAQPFSMAHFFSDPSHVLIALATLILGLSTGLADLNAWRHLTLLNQTARKLHTYSEWLLGRDLLGRALNKPESMRLTRRERTILFADIRSFTDWSEHHTPEEVAGLLDGYYRAIEKKFLEFQVIKYKFTADEVMAVFIDPTEAVTAGRALCDTLHGLLAPHDLGAGIGIHTGQVVEGLLGGENVRFYDVLGDTVNTAKRIESAALAHEVWVSHATREKLDAFDESAQKQVAVKGKKHPIHIYAA